MAVSGSLAGRSQWLSIFKSHVERIEFTSVVNRQLGSFEVVLRGPSNKMNLNLSASLNIFKLIANPSLCLPHATISSFKDLPIPLDAAFRQKHKTVEIKAVILDKDDCFAVPETNTIHEPYQVQYQET